VDITSLGPLKRGASVRAEGAGTNRELTGKKRGVKGKYMGLPWLEPKLIKTNEQV
jgi:hypothetical protein